MMNYEVIGSTVFKGRRALAQVVNESRSLRIAFAILLDYFADEDFAEAKAWGAARFLANVLPDADFVVSEEWVESQVIDIMLAAARAVGKIPEVAYVAGQRRDTVRDHTAISIFRRIP